MDWLVLTRQRQIRLPCYWLELGFCFDFEAHAMLLPLSHLAMLKPSGKTK
jgi:hypothetical protein